MKAFLLGFEETVGDSFCGSASQRSPASNCASADDSAAMAAGGTQTFTEVRNEAADKDRIAHTLLAFPH